MTDDERYMAMAIGEARKAFESDEVPVGCVIVCENRVVGRGYNLTETLSDVTAHAEIQAITAAAQTLGGKYLQGCTMYVTMEPCVMCAGAIGWAQVSRLVYGASDEKKGYSILSSGALHPKCQVEKGILENECKELIKSFFERKRKRAE
ncbi:MAG: nucleoside deaminase [Paludibacteraceae bacterium]|nr:nucleoside deaminase [Paludibacteraceae bacterium]